MNRSTLTFLAATTLSWAILANAADTYPEAKPQKVSSDLFVVPDGLEVTVWAHLSSAF